MVLLLTIPVSAFADETRESELKEVQNALFKCHDFTVRKLVRSYGKTADPAALADMAFQECHEFEEMLRQTTFRENADKDQAKIAFADFKMEIHSILTEMIKVLQKD